MGCIRERGSTSGRVRCLQVHGSARRRRVWLQTGDGPQARPRYSRSTGECGRPYLYRQNVLPRLRLVVPTFDHQRGFTRRPLPRRRRVKLQPGEDPQMRLRQRRGNGGSRPIVLCVPSLRPPPVLRTVVRRLTAGLALTTLKSNAPTGRTSPRASVHNAVEAVENCGRSYFVCRHYALSR